MEFVGTFQFLACIMSVTSGSCPGQRLSGIKLYVNEILILQKGFGFAFNLTKAIDWEMFTDINSVPTK